MLIPATFTAPEGITVTVLNSATSSTNFNDFYLLTVPSTNTYSTDQFASLEKLGVVALPFGGRRHGPELSNVDLSCDYWSSSAVYSVYTTYGSSGRPLNYNLRDNSGGRYVGRSVRLVHDLNYDIHFVNPDGTTLLDTTVERGVTPTYRGTNYGL